MNDIGLFISTFGGIGMFIWYLLNRERTTAKEQTDAVNKLVYTIDNQSEAIDDLTTSIQDLLDYLTQDYADKRRVKDARARVKQRQYNRERDQ